MAVAGIAVCVASLLGACASPSSDSHAIPLPLAKLVTLGQFAPHAKEICSTQGHALAAADSSVGAVQDVARHVETRQTTKEFDSGMPDAAGSYVALCVFSTRSVAGFSKKYRYYAQWVTETDGNDIVTAW
jgi:hypothetical protein